MTACGSTSIFTIRLLAVAMILSQATRRTALKTKKCSLVFCRAKKPIPPLMRSGKSLSSMGSSRAQAERRDESGRASETPEQRILLRFVHKWMALSGLSLYLKAPQLAASLGLLESDGQGRPPKQIHTLRRPVVSLE